MIGQVLINDELAIVLSDRMIWTSPLFPELALHLNEKYQGTYTEWNGQPGRWQLEDVAQFIGGTVEVKS
jgi:hypothetical protein